MNIQVYGNATGEDSLFFVEHTVHGVKRAHGVTFMRYYDVKSIFLMNDLDFTFFKKYQ